MIHPPIREEILATGVVHRRRIPERLKTPWVVALICIDAMAVLAASYAAGMPAAVGPAVCVIVCGALALCGTYQRSYAVRWYDESYQVVTGVVVAAIPVWLLLHYVGELPAIEPLATLGLAAIFMSIVHSMLHLAHYGTINVPEATSHYVSPEAQWRVGHPPFRMWKRGVDVVLSLAGILVTSPLLILAAVCIAIESGFPILFRQERVGRGGVPFVMYKFRTMWPNAGQEWASPGDRRITNVGALLRRSSIDELPQLFNVLMGEMSLVGPRPEMPEFAHRFRRTIRGYDDRHIVAPGLTGWAQVYAKRNLTPQEMPSVVPYDLFYIEHASPVVDAIVIVKTAVEFLFQRAV